jgi:polyisoprenyl-phosphate glycosyltransferase
MVKYSVVVPVYSGELTLIELNRQLASFFIENGFEYELIYVYDCGKDNSLNILHQIKKEFHNVKILKLHRNFGQHNAIICGIKYASGDFIITIDEDLQQAPKDIMKLIKKQYEGNFDVVYGKYTELKHTGFRNITSFLLKKLLSVSLPDLHKDYSAFRLIKKNIAKKTLEMNNSYTFLDGYLSWLTNNANSVEVSHFERYAGRSSYNFRMLLNHTINILFTFSKVPARVLSSVSFIVFFSFLGYAIYLFIRKILFNDLITGYSSTIIILGMGIGSILFGLSIIAEYLYRINLKVTKNLNFFEEEIS